MESGGASPMPSASRISTPTTSATVHSNLSQVTSAADIADPSLPKKTKICVYCGSSPGKNPVYMQAARDLARVMAENNIGLGRSPFTLPASFFASPTKTSQYTAAEPSA